MISEVKEEYSVKFPREARQSIPLLRYPINGGRKDDMLIIARKMLKNAGKCDKL